MKRYGSREVDVRNVTQPNSGLLKILYLSEGVGYHYWQ